MESLEEDSPRRRALPCRAVRGVSMLNAVTFILALLSFSSSPFSPFFLFEERWNI